MLPKGRVDPVIRRLKGLGVALFVIGLVFVAAGAYAYVKVQDGTKSLQAYSAAEAVNLNYNADGKLLDHGEDLPALTGLKLSIVFRKPRTQPTINEIPDPFSPIGFAIRQDEVHYSRLQVDRRIVGTTFI